MDGDEEDAFLESLALDNMHIGEGLVGSVRFESASLSAVLSEVLAGPIPFCNWLERQNHSRPYFASVWLADYLTQVTSLGVVHAFAAEDHGVYLVALETGTIIDVPEWLRVLGAWFRADRFVLRAAVAAQVTGIP